MQRKQSFIQVSIVVLVFILLGCKKNSVENSDTINTDIITGRVIAPAGMPTEGWKVNSGFSEIVVTGGNYSIEVAKDDFSLQFVSDANGKNILLGLKYPGQVDFTINSASTIVALLLQMPAVSSLTPAGKVDFINSIKSNTLFSSTVQILESELIAGADLFDTSNTALNGLLVQLFESASLRTTGGFSDNVNIIRSGKNLIFQNPGKPFTQVIGIYKNNQRIQKIELGGYSYFASGLTGIASAIANSSDPIEVNYTLGGDGDYDIRVRTGRTINSVEGKEALKVNLFNFSINNISTLIKFIPFLNMNNECVKEIRTLAASKVSTIVDASTQNISDAAKLTSIISEISVFTIDVVKTSNKCANKPQATGFFGKVIKLLKFIDQVSTVSTVMNNTIFAYQFFASPAAADTCFSVQGTTVTTCSGCDGGVNNVTDVDGNVYRVVKIGNQCWMAENLRTTRYKDSTAIPTGLGNTAWQTTTSGAYAIYDNNVANNTTYGNLYNWYAINSGKLAPEGWHIPTDDEWTTLTTYLGGEAVAGGLMKSTTLWSSPNTGATNSSGFSGLPAGFRYKDGTYGSMGLIGSWWSSTKAFTSVEDSAWLRMLNYNYSFIERSPYSRNIGFSVRCVKD